jgi:hypothetical protein
MRTMHTTASVIERMAERSGNPIELTADAAFLTVGRTTWIAPLPKAGA